MEYFLSLTEEEWNELREMARAIYGKWGEHSDELEPPVYSLLTKLGFSTQDIETMRTSG